MRAKGCTICGSPIPYYADRTLCGWHLYEQAQTQGPADPALDIGQDMDPDGDFLRPSPGEGVPPRRE